MSRLNTTLKSLGLTAAALMVAGCNNQPPPPPYGSNLQPAADQPMTPAVVTVPAGARPLATGTYDQIRFTVPYETGLLYIYDRDTDKVVGTTNATQTDSGKSETMTDLKNTAQGLSMTDHYQILFAPSQPTTHPLGGM